MLFSQTTRSVSLALGHVTERFPDSARSANRVIITDAHEAAAGTQPVDEVGPVGRSPCHLELFELGGRLAPILPVASIGAPFGLPDGVCPLADPIFLITNHDAPTRNVNSMIKSYEISLTEWLLPEENFEANCFQTASKKTTFASVLPLGKLNKDAIGIAQKSDLVQNFGIVSETRALFYLNARRFKLRKGFVDAAEQKRQVA